MRNKQGVKTAGTVQAGPASTIGGHTAIRLLPRDKILMPKELLDHMYEALDSAIMLLDQVRAVMESHAATDFDPPTVLHGAIALVEGVFDVCDEFLMAAPPHMVVRGKTS